VSVEKNWKIISIGNDFLNRTQKGQQLREKDHQMEKNRGNEPILITKYIWKCSNGNSLYSSTKQCPFKEK
jgi:hypothetical protein